jgi:LuxR family maltose regulon positive regulatory protein
MSITLRDARITIPQLPPGYVSRPRLLAQLNRAADQPLTLVCAGPGAGKTVLLADWAQRVNARVIWLSPAAADADADRFWRLVESALQDSLDAAGVDAAGIDAAGIGAAGIGAAGADAAAADTVPGDAALLEPEQDLARMLARGVPEPPVPVVLIIDDAHVLSSPAVLDGLDNLIRSPHPGLRLVLAGRSDPLLPLHKYRLAGQLLELRAPDLAMTPAETREVLTVHGVSLSGAEFGSLVWRTEGWAAGVRLAAMRMTSASHPGTLVMQLAMGPGSIGEYLVGEVLDQLPAQQRRLLIETSFLDEVTGPLADAVTGLNGCGDLLDDLARRNSFVLPLDPLQTRYRYHRLFREVLRYHLDRRDGPSVQLLKQRAADWFEANDDLSAAVHWTMQAGQSQAAATLLAKGGLAQAFVRRFDLSGLGLHTLLGQGAAADAADDRLARDGRGTQASAGPADEAAVTRLVIAAVCASPESASAELERYETLRPLLAQLGPAVTAAADLAGLLLAQQACDADRVDAAARRLLGAGRDDSGHAPPPGLRAAVLLTQASAHLWAGKRDDVAALLDAAREAAHRAGQPGLELEALSMLAFTESFRSRIGHADQFMQRARALARGAGLETPPALDLTAAVRAVTGGDFGAQARALQRVVPSTALGADPGLPVARTLGEASLALARGQNAEARATLMQLASRTIPPLLAVLRDVMIAGLDTALGRPRSALTLLDRYQGTEFAVHTAAARAQAHLAFGDRDRARDCVRGALTTPSAPVSRLQLVAVLLQDARIAQADGEQGRAIEVLSQAIDMARGEIMLPFLQAGDCFTDLLARHPDVADQWPVSLPDPVPAQPGVALVPAPRPPALTDPLTQRELTILRLLTTSMSTGEIADELCLSVNTVKTHLAAIYRKLLASRRREAVQRARELELI